MTPYEIKKQLGRGTLTKVARRLDVQVGHVSQVVSGKRRSRRVERVIARRLGKKADEVFPVREEAA